MNLGEGGAESTLQEQFVWLNFRDTEQPLSYIIKLSFLDKKGNPL